MVSYTRQTPTRDHALFVHRRYSHWKEIDQPKQLFLETTLVTAHGTAAALVIPDRPAYLALAQRILSAIHQQTGSRLPIYRDTQLDPWSPPTQNLIILGNLLENRLFAPLYARRKTFVDSRYPGKGGYLLQTVHDPWGTGCNIMIVGGSDSRGVALGVDRLLAMLKLSMLKADGKTLSLPPLLEVKVSDETMAKIPPLAQEPDEGFIAQQVEEAHHMLETGAHGGITGPLGQAGIYYAATGHVGWAELFKRLAYLMYEDFQKGREQYGGPWGMDADFRLPIMMPAFVLAETAPVMTDADRLAITQIYAQFIEDAVPHARDAVLHRRTRHNHWTFAALGLLHSAIYFQTYYGVSEADHWLYVADECFVPQSHSARSHENSNGYQWLTLGHTLEYALIRPYPAFFDEGHVRAICNLAIDSMDNLGYQSSYGDTSHVYGWGSEFPILAAAAWYYQDGRYQWALEHTRYAREFQIGTGAVGGYRTDIEPVEPVELTGAHYVPLDPTFHASFDGDAVLPAERAYDKVVFRADFDPASEYLLLDGLAVGGHKHYDCNALIRLTALERIWLADGDYYCSSPNFHTGILPLSGGRSSQMPPFTWRDFVVDLPKSGFSRTTVKQYGGVDWERNILWRKGGYFLVIDAMRALSDESYDFRAMWRVLGETQLDPARLSVRQQDRCLTITNLDRASQSLSADRFGTADWSVYPYAEPVVKVLGQNRSRHLERGEQEFFLNLLQPHMAADAPLPAKRHSPSSVLVQEAAGIVWFGVREAGAVAAEELQTDAELWALGADDVSLVQATYLRCGSPFFEAEYPVHLALDLSNYQGEVIASRATLLRFMDIDAASVEVDGRLRAVGRQEGSFTFSVPPGKHTFRIVAAVDESHNATLRRTLARWWQAATVPGSDVEEADERAVDTPQWHSLAGQSVPVLSLLAQGSEAGVIAGDDQGHVTLLTRDGTTRWSAQIEGRITALTHAQGRDGVPMIIAGSSASKVTAFALDGSLLWEYAIPYYKRDGIVRVLLAADINGDGSDEIIAGAENWHYYTLTADGTRLWQFESVHASSAGAVADLDNDGKLELVAGTEYYWWFGVDNQGQRKWQHNTVQSPGVTHVAVARQADGSYHTAFGCRDGSIQVVDAAGKLQYVFHTADTVTGLAAADVNGDGIEELLACSAIQNSYCLDSKGEVVWLHRHRTPPTHLHLSRGADGLRVPESLYVIVAEQSGLVQWLDSTGRVVSEVESGGPLAAMTFIPGDPGGTLVAARASEGVMGWRV
jgi:hypothetical protein